MAEIRADRLATAARSLALAGRWAQAAELLDAATAASPGEAAVLAVGQAEVAVDRDFWGRTSLGSAAVDRARAAVEGAAGGDRDMEFDVAFLRLKHDYAEELFGPGGGTPRFGPRDRDPQVIEDLAKRAGRLRATAPDRGREAAATFYVGLVEDNLRGDEVAGRSAFTAALALAEEAGEELIISEALRHLGYHVGQAGDADQARRMWERSAEQRQRAGAVPYVLSQQLLLAELTREGGDLDAARAVAREAGRWAHALGIGILEAQAARIAGEEAGSRLLAGLAGV